MDSFTTEETLAYESILLLVLATRAPPRGDGGQQSNLAEPWVNGYRAVMASTSKCFTMQGRYTPVSATGQGEKAGPQSSSSSDRSILVTKIEIHSVTSVANLNLQYRKSLTEKLKSVYSKCFGINITKQGEGCMPNKVCGRCNTVLWKWEKSNERKHLLFSKPMMWSTPASREDCYFCMTKTSGFTAATKASISYANVSSVVKPERMKTFTQKELNDLVRDLGLPKDGAEYLAAALKRKHLLANGTTAYFYRDREKKFRKFFTNDTENSLVYCSDVKALVDELKPNVYEDEEWRLFIDSSKRSLKAVLLHNGNTFAPIPMAHSTKLKETYENLKIVLDKIKYSEPQWQVCGDLKIATLLLGQQSGYTKNPCFLCLWDSRDRINHYVKKEWEKRTNFIPGSKNILHKPLIEPSKYLLPPLHIKLGLMKQYVKALDKEKDCFRYLQEKFPAISDAKLKEGIFDGPQIRRLFEDANFITSMDNTEEAAWRSLKNVSQNFLGNSKSKDYENIVDGLLENYKNLGCLMNLKLHFLHSHLDYFPENLGDYSEEQGERFHQDISEMENRYQGRWDVNMMADFCWMLQRDEKKKNKKRNRNPLHRSFEEKRVRYKRRRTV